MMSIMRAAPWVAIGSVGAVPGSMSGAHRLRGRAIDVGPGALVFHGHAPGRSAAVLAPTVVSAGLADGDGCQVRLPAVERVVVQEDQLVTGRRCGHASTVEVGDAPT